MNVVIPDSQLLPTDVEFPPLAANKFGWQQLCNTIVSLIDHYELQK